MRSYQSLNSSVHFLQILLLLALLGSISQCQSPPIQTLNLSQILQQKQRANTYQYFQLTFNITAPLLQITLNYDQYTSVGIYISIHPTGSNQAYYTYPNDTHNTKQCDQSSFDTCIVRLEKYNTSPNTQITVYFSVYTYSDLAYNVLVNIDKFFNANIQRRYWVNFDSYQSVFLKIDGNQFIGTEQIVLVLSYNTSGKVGKFKIKAAVDDLPSQYPSLTGVTVGAYSKILKLSPIQNTSDYYIQIEGQNGTQFSLSFYDSTPSAPSIAINTSIIYHTYNNVSYHTITNFENMQLPLFIRLDAFLGYGVFSIDYCGGLMESTFQNINGENGQIVITPMQRINCKQKMISTSFGLLAQNIMVDVINVQYQFGYRIDLFEGNYSVNLRVNEEQYGVFLYFEESRTYNIELPIDISDDLFLTFNQITQTKNNSLLFEIEQCQRKKSRDKCKVVASSKGVISGQLMFTPKVNMTYDVKLSYPNSSSQTTSLQYVLQVYSQTKTSTILVPSRLYLEEIEENEYKFYQINLTQLQDEQAIKLKNFSVLVIHIKKLNGDVTLLSSLETPQPTEQKRKQNNSDIIYNWSGSTVYIVNMTTKMIYIGVRGYQQALYYLHYTLDVDADIPAKYTKLVDGTQNNYELNSNSSYRLLSFSSHTIPYKIAITGNPSCIKFGYTLPLNQTCSSSLPTEFTEKVVYLNISNGDFTKKNLKFSVYINSGDYFLDDKDPILIGCEEVCYEIVTVSLKNASNIIHQGRGLIYQLSNPTKTASNNYLTLACQSYPCITKINASIPYSGQMILYLESSEIQQIGWNGIPITFGTYPKKYIFEIRQWSDINNVLIYSQAMQLDAYYNIVDIQEKQTSIINYEFPTESLYEAKSVGNPLRNIHTIVIDEKLIQSKNCKNRGNFCLVALSIYPNLNVEYNENYKNHGIGFISSNTYQYYIYLNQPFHFTGQFSMSLWGYNRNDKQIDTPFGYRVNIEPLSNCHPKLYTGLQSRNPTFEDPMYDDGVVKFNADWMNFTILVEKPCAYVVTLTNSPFETVIQDKYYYLSLAKNQVTVLYRNSYSSEFTIEADTGSKFSKIDSIIVNKIEGNNITVGSLIKNTAFAINKSSLVVKEAEYSLYAITIISKVENIELLIRKTNKIVLIHNQEHRQAIAPNSNISYRIISTGSVALFLVTDKQRPQVTISKNNNVNNTFITNQSSPWIYIDAHTNDLETYDITINNQANEGITITIMYEENDSLAYQKLYEGIIVYDAFVTKQEMNCYTYQSPMLVGRKDITLDFVIAKKYIANSANCQSTNSCLNIQYKAMAKDSIVKSNFQLLKSNGTAYRLKVDFVPKQNYTFCFHTPNSSILNLQYYILLNDPTMDHLIEDYTLTQSYENQYDMYEIVQEGHNENILIELTACNPTQKNERVIVGSSSFTDSENGRFTDLQDYYKNSDSIFARLQVKEGYYYLGVKNSIYLNEFLNIYTVKFQNMGADDSILANTWHLKEKKIVKIFNNKKTDLINIEVPQIISAASNPQDNITITYTIHILNMKKNESASKIPLNILARCPDYHESKLNEGFGRQSVINTNILKKSITFYYPNLQAYQERQSVPVFQLSQSELPKKYNITGRIDVKANSQKFSYYYDTTSSTYEQEDNGQTQGATILVSIILIFTAIVIIGVSAFVCYRRYKRNEDAKKVAFEMANFNHAEGESEVRKQQREMLTVKTSNTKGYGDLVDEL